MLMGLKWSSPCLCQKYQWLIQGVNHLRPLWVHYDSQNGAICNWVWNDDKVAMNQHHAVMVCPFLTRNVPELQFQAHTCPYLMLVGLKWSPPCICEKYDWLIHGVNHLRPQWIMVDKHGWTFFVFTFSGPQWAWTWPRQCPSASPPSPAWAPKARKGPHRMSIADGICSSKDPVHLAAHLGNEADMGEKDLDRWTCNANQTDIPSLKHKNII